MKRLILIATLITTAPAFAQQTSGDHSAHHPAPIQAQQSALVDGEVRKVDMDAKKITLRHGAIPNLDMPPMTMVFQVKNPALLGQFKAGDKVRFSAEKSGGAYTVTSMESVK